MVFNFLSGPCLPARHWFFVFLSTYSSAMGYDKGNKKRFIIAADAPTGMGRIRSIVRHEGHWEEGA